MAAGPQTSAFFDEPTNAVSYLVADLETGAAAVIDRCWNMAQGNQFTRC